MINLSLFLLSFISGILTVLAPCVLPLLPIIIGSSVSEKNNFKPYLVILGLIISIVVFTIILKGSTLFIDIDQSIWKYISGGIVFLFGLIYIFPELWDRISVKFNLSSKSDNILHEATKKEGFLGSLMIGGALGPVFASCSPTYALIIATVLPVSFFEGVIYIIVYAFGLALIMLLIALLGRKIISKLKIYSDPNGWFKKTLGFIFIIIALSVITGLDKIIETNLLNNPNFFDITKVEQSLLELFKLK
jgi:cytochrome c-type biogenesis protein